MQRWKLRRYRVQSLIILCLNDLICYEVLRQDTRQHVFYVECAELVNFLNKLLYFVPYIDPLLFGAVAANVSQ